MNDHDLINNVSERQAEKTRWAKVLCDYCCTYGECVGGHGCPVRQTSAEQLVWPALDLPAPKYCERTKQHCNTPWTCSSQCRVIDSQLPVQMFEPPRWYQMPGAMTAFFTIACALIAFAAAVYQIFLSRKL